MIGWEQNYQEKMDYECLRAFRDSTYMNQNPETIKEFAQGYLQFKDSLNHYSLFVWGYVMLMLDYHKKKDHMANPT